MNKKSDCKYIGNDTELDIEKLKKIKYFGKDCWEKIGNFVGDLYFIDHMKKFNDVKVELLNAFDFTNFSSDKPLPKYHRCFIYKKNHTCYYITNSIEANEMNRELYPKYAMSWVNLYH